MKIILIVLILTTLLTPQISRCQDTGIDSIKLDYALNKLINKYKTPDADFAISRNDSVIFSLSKNPKHVNRNYYIGSCSKSFTALALLQLVDAGQVELDKPVDEYLHWFELKNNNQSKQITVRHLLNQTSGFKTIDGFFDYLTSNQSEYETQIATFVKSLTLRANPGAEFNYCNLNFILAGLIITHVTNESYSSYLKKNIFTKIGMLNTYASRTETESASPIPGYQYYFNLSPISAKFAHSDFNVPQGLISSNTGDLSAYLNCILNNCTTKNGDTLLSALSYNLFITPLKYGYAMGWMGNKIVYNSDFNRQHDFPFIYHTGVNENYNSVLAIYPERKICIVVLSNINSLEFSKEAMNSILSTITNKPYTSGSSIEIIERNLLLPAIMLLAAGLFYNIYRWKKYGFRFGLTARLSAIIRLASGLTFAIVILFVIPGMNNISLSSLISYVPDFGFGLMVLATLGSLSSIVRYEGTYSKYLIPKS